MSTKKKSRQIRIDYMLKEYILKVGAGFSNFWKNHGAIIAASSAFYAILSSLPLIITTVTITGFMIGDYKIAQVEVINYVKLAFPNVSPWVFATIKNIVANHVGPNSTLSILNLAVLIFSGMGFINSIFNGVHILSQVKVHRTLFIPVKSILVLIMTIVAAFLMIFLSSSTIFWMIILLYFTILFYFILGRTISFKDAFLGSFTFGVLFLISKIVFAFYLSYGRATLIHNFGDFYAMLVAVLWLYFIMISFFLSVSVSMSRVSRK